MLRLKLISRIRSGNLVPAKGMTIITLNVNSRSLDVRNQVKVVMLRRTQELPWTEICRQVVNLQGERPSVQHVINVYNKFDQRKGYVPYRYQRCGRQAWKVTPAVKKYLVQRLLVLRKRCVCTSTTLQKELAQNKGVSLEVSTIRKILRLSGFKWLPRSQKPQFSRIERLVRLAWSRALLRLTAAELRAKMALCMDGVIIGTPPTDPTQRANHCHVGETHMWRKPGETAKPELSGGTRYGKQIPLSRAIALWGGVSMGGFAPILFHRCKKLCSADWVEALKEKVLTDAIKSLSPVRRSGPWHVICDNESFLSARVCQDIYRKQRVVLWKIPARSPDLNPVEKFWHWLRKELRRRDLADLVNKRPVLGKIAYKTRIRAVIRSAKAQRVAKNYAAGLRKVCKEVVEKKGAMARG